MIEWLKENWFFFWIVGTYALMYTMGFEHGRQK